MQKSSSGFERIAHRGASGEAPENTIPAFEIALQKYHCDAVEFDLRLTQDNVPIVIHDADLERTTNGKGSVHQHPLRALKMLDAGYRFDPRGKGEFPYRGKGVTIPTLEEVLIQFPKSRFCLEIKDRKGKIVEKTLDVFSRIPSESRIIIGSFSGRTARKLRRLAQNRYETFLAEDEVVSAYVAFRLGLQKIPLSAFHISLPRAKYGIRLDGRPWIEFLHRLGARVYYWTVNDAKEMEELLQRGANGVMTNYPDRLQSWRAP